jgi:hypothetical protein
MTGWCEKLAVMDKSERRSALAFASWTHSVAEVRTIEKCFNECSELKFSRVRENSARFKRTQQRQVTHTT